MKDSFLPRCIVKKDKNPDRAMWWNPTNGKLTSHCTASQDFWCVHRILPTTLRASMTNGRQNCFCRTCNGRIGDRGGQGTRGEHVLFRCHEWIKASPESMDDSSLLWVYGQKSDRMLWWCMTSPWLARPLFGSRPIGENLTKTVNSFIHRRDQDESAPPI